MITKAIRNAIAARSEKGWERTYWAVDIHGTMIVPNFTGGKIPTEFYPWAREVLQRISLIDDVVLILFTCSHPEELELYREYFESHQIRFQYFNTNPEVSNGAYGCYDQKIYFNVLFEDKAGFDPHEDWEKVHALLDELNL